MLVFTSTVNNYIPKARVLAASLKAIHPDWRFCLLLGENPPPGFDLAAEPFDRLLLHEELDIPDFPSFRFQHGIVEICTAVKGCAMLRFLEQENEEQVMYLDPDILVLNSLQPLADMLAHHDILLTPHMLTPQRGRRAIEDNELSALTHGIFNLGFLACANRPQGRAFASFWRDRLGEYCHDDKLRGLFTDQKWCDFVPAYFSAAHIVRDPGCNAASWNLADRFISRAPDGAFLANGQPLRFYHFTGHDSGSGRLMSHIYGRSMPAVAELWHLYDAKLADAGQEYLGKLPWAGNFYSNGQPIDDSARMYYRATPAIRAHFPNPFATDAAGKTGFAGYFRQKRGREQSAARRIGGKPMRLLVFALRHLRLNGGPRHVPALAGAGADIWRREGAASLYSRLRSHIRHAHSESRPILLEDLLYPVNAVQRLWRETLRAAFGKGDGALIFDHCYGGGANAFRQQQAAQWLGSGRPCLLLAWQVHENRVSLEFMLPDGRALTVYAPDLAGLQGCEIFRFDLIHVNELVHWFAREDSARDAYAALPRLLQNILAMRRKWSAKLEMSLHDFYPICPACHLYRNGLPCSLAANAQACAACIAETGKNMPHKADFSAWRGHWQDFLDNADTVIVFSRASEEILRAHFSFRQGQITIKPHAPLASFEPVHIQPGGPLRIGIIGNIGAHKGSRIVRELAALLEPDEKLFVAGELDMPVDNMPDNITVTGAYEHAQLPKIIARLGINCVLIPSLCPETFCYTAQEARQMDLPLVVFPIGALPERVEGYAKGAVAADLTAEAALAALRDLHQHAPQKSA